MDLQKKKEEYQKSLEQVSSQLNQGKEQIAELERVQQRLVGAIAAVDELLAPPQDTVDTKEDPALA